MKNLLSKFWGESFLSIESKDLIKAGIMAGIAAIGSSVYGIVNQTPIDFTLLLTGGFWAHQVKVAVGIAVGYILKNFLTNSEGKFLKKDSDPSSL